MKTQNNYIQRHLVTMLILIACISFTSAQTHTDIEKAAIDAFTKRNLQNAREFQEMIKQKEDEKRGIAKKDPVLVLKKIHVYLIEFESDMGHFPSELAIEENDELQSGNHLAKDSSNRYFAMLIAGGYCDSKEEVLFSLPFEAIKVENADQDVSEGKLLEAGECSITYNRVTVANRKDKPLALYPVTPGKTSFDVTAAGGKAYVLHLDGNVAVYDVAQDGSVMLNGKSFFDPAQPHWDGQMNLCHPMIKE